MFGIDDAILIPAAASLIGGMMTHEGAEDANAANSAQAANQMAFQREMSNTSYQRAVKDMQAAGLNPMLAYSQGGATTPGGAMAQMQNTLGQGVTSAQIGAKVIPEVQQAQAQIKNIEAGTEKQISEAAVNNSQAALNWVTIPKAEQETRTSGSSAAHFDALARQVNELLEYYKGDLHSRAGKAYTETKGLERGLSADRPEVEVMELLERARLHGAHRGLTGTETELKGLQLPEARNRAAAQSSWWMRQVHPYVDDAHKLGNSAADLMRLMPFGRTFYRGRP